MNPRTRRTLPPLVALAVNAGIVFSAAPGQAQNHPPTVPVLISPEADAVASARRLRFEVSATDEDNDRLTFQIVVVQAKEPPPPVEGSRAGARVWTFDPGHSGWDQTDYASRETATLQVPVDEQLPGGDYSWWALAFDGEAWSEGGEARPMTLVGNRLPDAVDDAKTTDEDTSVDVAVLANDTDADGDPLTLESVTSPAHGTAEINPDSTVKYTPNPNFHGPDPFTYTVHDGQGGTDTATVTVMVNPVNDPPDAADDTKTTDEDTAVVVAVLNNDTDADGDALSVERVTSPAHGTAEITADGAVKYTPEANFHGEDTFTYTVNDGQGGTATATVRVTVNPVNDAPGVPALVSPEDHAEVSPTPTFRLKADDPDGDEVKFTIEVSEGRAVRTFETDWVASGEEATFSVPAGQALPVGLGSWRGKAVDRPGAESDWSAPRALTVVKNDPPSIPTLLAPEDGMIVPPTPTFRLRAEDPDGDEVMFTIEVQEGRTVQTFATGWVASGAGATWQIPSGQALAAGAWSWRAKAQDRRKTEGPWSGSRTFQVPATLPDVTHTGGLSTLGLAVQMGAVTPADLGLQGMRIAAWDAAHQRYLVDAEVPPFQAGAGYWLKAGGPVPMQFAGPAVTDPFPIPLQPGWNLISPPFLEPVVFDVRTLRVRRNGEEKSLLEARDAGWIEAFAWGWEQDAVDPNTGRYFLISDRDFLPTLPNLLEPWRAYWVQANVACALVLLPPGEQGSRGAGEQGSRGARETTLHPSSLIPHPSSLTSGTLGTLGTSPGWNVRLQAQTASGAAEVILGEASGGRALAVGQPPEPPAGDRGIRLALLRDGQPLAVDVRQRTVGKQVWELAVEPVPFVVRHESAVPRGTRRPAIEDAEEVLLTWPHLKTVPSDVALTLVDTVTGARRSLHTTTHYVYRPTQGEVSRRFQILAEPGRERTLQIANLGVQSARGGRLIHFTLNRAAVTTVVLRSLSGPEVTAMEQMRSRSAGMNVVTWDWRDAQGRPLPPGVYLVEVQAVDEEGQQVRAARTVTLR